LEFVDEILSSNLPAGTQALVEVIHDQNTVLQELISKTQEESALVLKKQNFLTQEEKVSKAITDSIKNQYVLRKFGSGALAAGSALITAIQSSITEALGAISLKIDPFIGGQIGLMFAFMTLLFGMFSFSAWMGEQRSIRERKEILSEEGFQRFINSSEFCGVLRVDGKYSLLDLTNAVEDFLRFNDKFVAQDVAELICQKLTLRDLVTPLDGAHLSPMYELNSGLTEELLHQPT